MKEANHAGRVRSWMRVRWRLTKAHYAAISFEVVEWSEQLRSVISAWLGAVRRSVQVWLCTSRCKSEKMFGIIIIIIVIIQKERLHNAVYKITKDGCHYMWRAQTALIRYARGPAEWLTLNVWYYLVCLVWMFGIIIIIIIIISIFYWKKQITRERYNTKHFLTLTPSCAESDLSATTNST